MPTQTAEWSIMMKFSEIPYIRPDFDGLLLDIKKVTDKFSVAQSAKEQYDIIIEFESALCNFQTMATVSHVRNSIDTRDEFYQKEEEFYLEKKPILTEKVLEFTSALVNTNYKEDLLKLIGDIPFINAELEIKSFSSDIVDLIQEEGALVHEYQNIYAKLQVEFDGKTMPLPMLGPYKESPDREIRKQAFIAEGKCFEAVSGKFDEIFDKLVKNRTAQAKKLGYENFVDVGYMRVQRNCYTKQDVSIFKNQVIDEIVPVVNEIREVQKQRIDISDLKFYDLPLTFKDGAATPQATSDEIMAAGKRMYQEMSPLTKEFVELMYDNELFDVLSKDGKRPGGYCTTIKKYKYPFIFSNFNGTAGDVDVLTHEAGHALAMYMNSRDFEISMMSDYSSEIAETHSMSMEFLTQPWHHLFFKEQTAKYELSHAEDALIFIPYGCQVDQFQEEIYSNPDLTPQERHEKWLEIESKFRPGIDYEDIPFYSRGAGWQRQLHIFHYPFYYIDYSMAQTMALQFFAKFLSNREKTLQMYFDFVKLGGSKTFVDIIKTTGFDSPLEEGSIKKIVGTLKIWLEKNQI